MDKFQITQHGQGCVVAKRGAQQVVISNVGGRGRWICETAKGPSDVTDMIHKPEALSHFLVRNCQEQRK